MTEKLNTKIEIVELNPEESFGKFMITPLERGYGTTLGNSLRRVLLSSLPGAAITKIKIDGVNHELSTIEGVLEDVTEIVLNLKDVAIKKHTEEPVTISVDLKGPHEFVAEDLSLDANIEIANPDHHICHLNEDAHIRMDVTIESGTGYEMSEQLKDRLNHEKEMALEGEDFGANTSQIGLIYLDCLYTPVEKVNYSVSSARVGQIIDYDKLVLEVWTDGTVTPQDAVAQGAKILIDYLDLFTQLPYYNLDNHDEYDTEGQKMEEEKLKSVETLELSLRSFNCLKRAGINTIGQLVTKSDEDLMKIKNFGRKSLDEVRDSLQARGLDLILSEKEKRGDNDE